MVRAGEKIAFEFAEYKGGKNRGFVLREWGNILILVAGLLVELV